MNDFFRHNFFRSFIFVLFINFETILEGDYPSLTTLSIQFIVALFYMYYFLPKTTRSKEKTAAKFNNKILAVITLVVLNLEHIIEKQIPSILGIALSLIFSIILIYYFLPLWKNSENK